MQGERTEADSQRAILLLGSGVWLTE